MNLSPKPCVKRMSGEIGRLEKLPKTVPETTIRNVSRNPMTVRGALREYTSSRSH